MTTERKHLLTLWGNKTNEPFSPSLLEFPSAELTQLQSHDRQETSQVLSEDSTSPQKSAKHWMVEMMVSRGRKQETATTCLVSKERGSKLWDEPKSCFTCHTAREQLVFILNEAPVGVFQAASPKNNLVTQTFRPGSHQEDRRDGVKEGRHSNSLHQPPTHASSHVSDMAWTDRWGGTRVSHMLTLCFLFTGCLKESIRDVLIPFLPSGFRYPD